MRLHTLFLLLLMTSLQAQVHIDARGLALSNAYTVTSRGISSIGHNPANLGFTDEVSLSVDLFDFRLAAQNNFMSLALFNTYFTGDINGDPVDLEEKMPGRDITHKEYLLDQLPEEGFALGLGMTIPFPLMNISMGNYAFSSGIEYYQKNSLPRGLFELAMDGNVVGKSLSLAISQDVILITKLGFSFAIPFENFNIGTSVKYLMGLGFAGVDSSGGSFSTRATGLESDGFYRYTRAIGGNGLAVDIGFTSHKKNNFQYGVAINNIIGLMNWGSENNLIAKNINAIEGIVDVRGMLGISSDSAKFSESTLYTMNMENVNVTGAFENPDSLFALDQESVPVPTGIQMNYPAILRLGASYQYEEDFIVMADLSAGLDDYYFADRTWRLALAAEWIRFKMVPLRSGFAFGGPYGREASLGAGFHMLWFDADVAIKFLGGMSLTGAEGIEFGLSVKFIK